MAMDLLGPVGTQFRLSVAPIKSTNWTLALLNSTTMQGLGTLSKKKDGGKGK